MSFISFRSTIVLRRLFALFFGVKRDTPDSSSRMVELPPNTVLKLTDVKVAGKPLELREFGRITNLSVQESNGGWRTISPKAFKESTDAFVEGKIDAMPGLNIDIAPEKFTLSRNEIDFVYRLVNDWGRHKIEFADSLRKYNNDISNAEVRYNAHAMNTSRDQFNEVLFKISVRHPSDRDTVVNVASITSLARAWIAWRVRSAEPGFTGTRFSENAARQEFRRYLKKFLNEQ